jgi:hypothetical protein
MVVARCSVIVDDMTGYRHAAGRKTSSLSFGGHAAVTTPGHMTVYRRQAKASQSTVAARSQFSCRQP